MPSTQAMTDLALDVQGLSVRFPVRRDWRGRVVQSVHALNGIDLSIQRGEAFGIVGESGCGKSTLAQVLMGLLPPTAGQVRHPVRADGRATNIQIVFQDPQSSLDPRLPAWRVIVEPLVVRGNKTAQGADLRARAADLALQVGLRPETLNRYIHEFSGGQRQRIAIARALSSNPDVIVLDEPTSALDISVQAQILNLLQDLRRRHGLTYILISHNVSVVRHLCDRVAVMYLGQIVEQGPTVAVLETPRHPYTRELLDAVPRLDKVWQDDGLMASVELPSNRVLPSGCFFQDRCPWATVGCEQPQQLQAREEDAARQFRCHVAVWRSD